MLDWSLSLERPHANHRSIPRMSPLGVDSTLEALPLHAAQLNIQVSGQVAAEQFNQFPELPGLLLTDQQTFVGVLSRQQFSEFLLRPKACELFMCEPLSVIYSYSRQNPLVFPAETLVLVAARAALRRPSELQAEPVLVLTPDGHRLVSAHDLNQAHWQIRGIATQVRYERTQATLLQSQKMAALGRLVDGIAHEIMDPLGFIWGNLSHVERYFQQLLELIAAYEEVCTQITETASLEELKEEIEFDYLHKDLPQTLNSIKGGAARLKQLAGSLQNFCHIDEVYPKPADLHGLIDSIVLLLKSRLTTQIQIVRDYGALPPVPCFAGQLSQVLMNVLTHCIDDLLSMAARQTVATDLTTNALDPTVNALDSTVTTLPKTPQITITTQLHDVSPDDPLSDRWIVLTITDNGPGLSESALKQIQDAFSISERLARETDLATCYRLITAKHGGKFTVRSPALHHSKSDRAIGTEFEIHLPLYRSDE
ncbi:MAG: ATP-binding protein [Cyanobacteria bacterium P01_D01_bin.6]